MRLYSLPNRNHRSPLVLPASNKSMGERKLLKARHIPFLFCLTLFLGWSCYAKAEQVSEMGTEKARGLYAKGQITLQLVSGALFSLTGFPENSPEFNYAQTNLRLGWMLTDPGQRRDFLSRKRQPSDRHNHARNQ